MNDYEIDQQVQQQIYEEIWRGVEPVEQIKLPERVKIENMKSEGSSKGGPSSPGKVVKRRRTERATRSQVFSHLGIVGIQRGFRKDVYIKGGYYLRPRSRRNSLTSLKSGKLIEQFIGTSQVRCLQCLVTWKLANSKIPQAGRWDLGNFKSCLLWLNTIPTSATTNPCRSRWERNWVSFPCLLELPIINLVNPLSLLLGGAWLAWF